MSGSADPGRLGLDPGLVRAGFNVAGVLSSGQYDGCVAPAWRTPTVLPGAQSVVVLATGGRPFFQMFSAARGDSSAGETSVDAFTRRVVEAASAFENEAGHASSAAFYFEQRDGAYADFVGLAAAAGLGAPSRLALLVHPEFGPWLAIRALLFTQRGLPATVRDPSFAPCDGCPAPCAEACPGSALPQAGFDLAACMATSRRVSACQTGCGARRACVVGATHRYSAAAEAHYRRAALDTPNFE